MASQPYYYEIAIDDERHPLRTIALWIVFVCLFMAIIACAVWVFCLGKRGLDFEPPHSPAQIQTAPATSTGPAIPFVGVSLSTSSITLTVGDRITLTALLKLAPGSPYIDVESLPLRWRSERPGIVSVDRHGGLVARQQGVARISVTVNDRRVDTNEAYCMVDVRPAPARHNTAHSPQPITQSTE